MSQAPSYRLLAQTRQNTLWVFRVVVCAEKCLVESFSSWGRPEYARVWMSEETVSAAHQWGRNASFSARSEGMHICPITADSARKEPLIRIKRFEGKASSFHYLGGWNGASFRDVTLRGGSWGPVRPPGPGVQPTRPRPHEAARPWRGARAPWEGQTWFSLVSGCPSLRGLACRPGYLATEAENCFLCVNTRKLIMHEAFRSSVQATEIGNLRAESAFWSWVVLCSF